MLEIKAIKLIKIQRFSILSTNILAYRPLLRWIIKIYRQCDEPSEKIRLERHRLAPHGLTNGDPKRLILQH